MVANMAKKSPARSTKPAPAPRAPELEDDRILTTKEVLARIPLDRSTLFVWSRDGKFPKPLRLGSHRIGWRLSAVMRWIEDAETHPITARVYFEAGTEAERARSLDR